MNADLADVGVASRTLPGQTQSGDAHVVAPFPDGLLVAVIDGLGHGLDAATASKAAVDSIVPCARETVISVVKRCHESLHVTRGAVMSLASFNAIGNTMTWLSIGNVDGCLVRADARIREKSYVLMRGGVVGHSLPPLRADVIVVNSGDTLVMATDGIRSGFVNELDPKDPPQKIADNIIARFARGTDDALVVVVRWLGGRR